MSTQLFYAPLLPIVISSGGTDSARYDFFKMAHDAEAIFIGAPSALEVNTYTFLVSDDDVTYFTLYDTSNNAVVVPAAGKAILYNGVLAGFKYLKIHSSGAVGADRSFTMSKSWRG